MTFMAKNESSKAVWLDKAEAYCARAEHCASEVRRKLQEWGADEDLYDEIVQNLYANDFLNDRRFCHAYVHDKLAYQHWGRVKTSGMLHALRLPESAIREAIASIDEREYTSILRSVASHATNKEGKKGDQLVRFLLQRGFTYEEITSCLRSARQ